MGEVYRARDTRLGREVALKVLPEELTKDTGRRARFEREARALAALNHPRIATLYGFERYGEQDVLVMELVLGETLAERIARGPLPLSQALPLFLQIAEGLEAAHEKGIVHRDLKPANLKIAAAPDAADGTPEEDAARVKILDFGLAKAMAPELASEAGGEPAAGASPAFTHSPTLTLDATRRGEILGTAAYMSPEQARGLPVDRRADVWAFGVCLYEALTGKPAFTGDDASSVLASVLKDEPALDALPAQTPRAVRTLLRRCLAKRAKDRVRDIGDVALELRETLQRGGQEESAALASAARSRWAGRWWLAGLIGAGMAAALVWVAKPTPLADARPLGRSFLDGSSAPAPFATRSVNSDVAIDWDGTVFAWLAENSTGQPQLMIRRLGELEERPLAGATGVAVAALSPDGRWVAYVDFVRTGGAMRLLKMPVDGGTPIHIADLSEIPAGFSWAEDGNIYVGAPSGLWRVAAAGGKLELVVGSDATAGETGILHPNLLPGSHIALVTLGHGYAIDQSSIAAIDLETGRRQLVLDSAGQPSYLEPGYLLYAKGDGGLLAARFDRESLAMRGDPVRVAEGIVTKLAGPMSYAISREGSLIYQSGQAFSSKLVWMDREGRETALPAPARWYHQPRLSPDGSRVAVADVLGTMDLWTLDLDRGTLTPLTVDSDFELGPLWSLDGRELFYEVLQRSGSSPASRMMVRSADGTGVARSVSDALAAPSSLSPDGRYLVYRTGAFGSYGLGLLTLATGATQPLLDGPHNEFNGEISPDGRLLAYQSDDSGRAEVYVRPFPEVERGRWPISSDGGVEPTWSRAGPEIFFLGLDRRMMVVSYDTRDGFHPSRPVELFRAPPLQGQLGRSYDVAADGKRFVMTRDARAEEGGGRMQIVLVQNLGAELERLLPSP